MAKELSKKAQIKLLKEIEEMLAYFWDGEFEEEIEALEQEQRDLEQRLGDEVLGLQGYRGGPG